MCKVLQRVIRNERKDRNSPWGAGNQRRCRWWWMSWCWGSRKIGTGEEEDALDLGASHNPGTIGKLKSSRRGFLGVLGQQCSPAVFTQVSGGGTGLCSLVCCMKRSSLGILCLLTFATNKSLYGGRGVKSGIQSFWLLKPRFRSETCGILTLTFISHVTFSKIPWFSHLQIGKIISASWNVCGDWQRWIHKRGRFYLELSLNLAESAASALHLKHGISHIQAFFGSKEISF